MRIEAGTSGIGPADLKHLTTCRDRDAKMELLVAETDDIIRRVREAAPTPQKEEAG